MKLDLNSFNLVTPLYDRVGLYLHPYAAFINHSCDYNSVVGFDGDKLFVKATRPIKADEQIFVSYVDTTNPYNIRHNQLAQRYYFGCNCSKCQQEKDAREDQFLPTSLSTSALEEIGEKARNLMASATTQDDQIKAVTKLKSAISMLRETSAWPITRQPYISLRDELIVSMLSAQQFQSAFLQAVIRYIRVDPVVYPYDGHPIRQMHAWSLAKLSIHLSQGVEVDSVDAIFGKYELNLGLIIWALLSWLVGKQKEACTVPSLREIIYTTFHEVDGEFRSNGLEPAKMAGEIKNEWEKLEALADEALNTE